MNNPQYLQWGEPFFDLLLKKYGVIGDGTTVSDISDFTVRLNDMRDMCEECYMLGTLIGWNDASFVDKDDS